MKYVRYFFVLLLLISLTACGGGAKTPEIPKAPPPPIDQDLLSLLPYETDVVMWLDFDALKKASIWTLIQEVFENDSIKIPGEAAMNPLFASHEAVLGFWESEQNGSQLLIVAKGDSATQATAVDNIVKQGDATEVTFEGFHGVKAKDFYLLSLTDRTIAFGNETIVRMSAKAAKKAGRSLIENPRYNDFNLEGTASAKLRYYSDRSKPLNNSLRSVTPRINPDAVTMLSGEFYTGTGLDIDLRMKTETQMDASVIAEDLNNSKGELSKNMVVLFLGVEWLLNRVQISSDKDVVNVDITLDERDVTELGNLMDRLQKIRELLGNQDAGGLLEK